MAKVLVVKRTNVAKIMQCMTPVFTAHAEPCIFKQPIPAEFFYIPTELVERELAEKDNTLLQIIPYITMIDSATGHYFTYTRGKAGGEVRLKTKVSIGLGGHIDTGIDKNNSFLSVIVSETARELAEEVGYVFTSETLTSLSRNIITLSNLIFNDSDEVGEVHLGISIIMFTDPKLFESKEHDVISNGKWRSKAEIDSCIADGTIEFEKWSEMVFLPNSKVS